MPTHGHLLAPTHGHLLASTRGHLLASTRGHLIAPTRGHLIAPTRGHLLASTHGHLVPSTPFTTALFGNGTRGCDSDCDAPSSDSDYDSGDRDYDSSGDYVCDHHCHCDYDAPYGDRDCNHHCDYIRNHDHDASSSTRGYAHDAPRANYDFNLNMARKYRLCSAPQQDVVCAQHRSDMPSTYSTTDRCRLGPAPQRDVLEVQEH
ncbi:hypothetical protein EV121DRAFT_293973 [Schizophyllum commune]